MLKKEKGFIAMILMNEFFKNSEKEFLKKLLFSIDLPVIVFDEQRSILFANERLIHILQINPEVLQNQNFFDITFDNKIKDQFYFLTTNIKFFDSENQKEIELPLNISIFEFEDKIYYLGTIHESYYDSLTRLPSLSIFELNLEKIIISAKRRNRILAVLFIDLDQFKFINDTYGHTIGDLVIQKVARILESTLRIDDLITRKGGDEFIVLLNDLATKEDIYYVIDKIFSYFDKPLQIENQFIPITLSIGISVFPDDGEVAKELIQKADQVMYKAKQIQKNSFAFYSESFEKELKQKHILEKKFITDYKNNFKNFEIVLQPIFSNINENRFCVEAFEVFLRWNNPQNSLLDVTQILEIAKRRGFIFEIDQFVISKILDFIKKNPVFTFPIHLNISSRMFYDVNFISFLKEIVEEYEVPPNMIVLEISEATFNINESYSVQTVQKLKENLFSICIDNFGKNINLFLLHHIKPKYVKIQILNDSYQNLKLIYEVIDSLYFTLKTKVIINKLEKMDLFKKILESKKIHYFQGFYFSKLLDLKEVITYLQKGSLYEF